MKNNCVILYHLFTGDCLTMYACIRYYLEEYKQVYIFCLKRCSKFINQLYDKHSNINIIVLPDDYEKNKMYYIVPINNISKYLPDIKDYDLIKTGNSFNEDGHIIPEWDKMTYLGEFWRKFYFQANLDYSIRNKYLHINRNCLRELELYNKIIKIYGKNYIFIQDHHHISYSHKGRMVHLNKECIINDNIPIFHPNANFYNEYKNHKFYNLWNKELISDNFLDYCMVLEKAHGIYMMDSSFSNLCAYLDLSNVKFKKLQTKLDYIDYHPMGDFDTWEIKSKF